MKKFVFRTLAILFAFAAGISAASAQMPQVAPMPVDSAVRVGTLPNGLTYYIRHNTTPKGQADFYIAQKVGSVLEEENQRGLAHFLEHMCFNGTQNFPGNSLIDYLESVGVKFGRNLNAYTSIDETVYNISNVPVARQGVIDSCLLILHDWADGLLLDPEEIEKERGVIHEEWRRSMQGSMRILENLLPKVFPNNRYGERLPIGTMEVVDNFPPQALRDYYETWYRPDQQGVVVVGDIDVDYVEGKIKELFSPIQMPENPKERVYFPVDDTPGTIYAIGSDLEMQAPVVMLMFKFDPMLSVEMRNTQFYYPIHFLTTMVDNMLQSRLNELSNKPDAEFAGASVGIDEFYVAKTKEALMAQITAKGGDVVPALKAVYREILRAQRGGFTQSEYDRARDEFLSRMERSYNERNNRQSGSYVNEYVRSFIDNYPIPGIEAEYEIYKAIAPMLPLEAMNQLLPEIVKTDNRVVMAMLPEVEGFVIPTEEQLAQALAEVEAEEIEVYQDDVKSEPLVPQLPKLGKIKSEKHLAQWDATELTLSNGVKVIVKPTTFKDNEIRFEAIAKGGLSSVMNKYSAENFRVYDYLAGVNGLGNYTQNDLTKYLQGKQASVGFDFSDYDRTLSGHSTVKDLPYMMELIYMTFTGYKIYDDEFEAMRAAIKSALANQLNTPEFVWQKTFMEDIFTSPAKQIFSIEDFTNADRAQIEGMTKDMLKNAADYTFVFVGNIDMGSFKLLAEQYLATLPANAKKVDNNIVRDAGLEIKKGKATSTHTTPMQTPQSYIFIAFGGETPYTAENAIMNSMASQILSKRLLNKVREEMGATYSIGCSSSFSRLKEYNNVFQIPFPMKPELKDETLPIIEKMVADMTSTITDDELNPVKEYMVKNAVEGLEENGNWVDAIASTTLNGVDRFNNQVDVINSITIEKLQKFMADVLAQGNYRVVILDAAE